MASESNILFYFINSVTPFYHVPSVPDWVRTSILFFKIYMLKLPDYRQTKSVLYRHLPEKQKTTLGLSQAKKHLITYECESCGEPKSAENRTIPR